MSDRLFAALKMLEGVTGTPFDMISWSKESQVLGFRNHGGSWINVWLETDHRDLMVIPNGNTDGADPEILWEWQ